MLYCLQLLHPDLPKVVKQRYGTELRSRTLASLKPEISQALTSLLESVECSRAMRAAAKLQRFMTVMEILADDVDPQESQVVQGTQSS